MLLICFSFEVLQYFTLSVVWKTANTKALLHPTAHYIFCFPGVWLLQAIRLNSFGNFISRFPQSKEFSAGSWVFLLIRSQCKSKKYSVYMNRNRSSLLRYFSAATVFKILSSIFFQVAPAQSLLTFADMVPVCGSLLSNFHSQAAKWHDFPRQYSPKNPAVTGF